jgi:hypothetical protein
MPEADPRLAQLPTEQDGLAVATAREINQANVEVLDSSAELAELSHELIEALGRQPALTLEGVSFGSLALTQEQSPLPSALPHLAILGNDVRHNPAYQRQGPIGLVH